MDREGGFRSIVDIALRLALVCASAYISSRILLSVLDPTTESKKRAKLAADKALRDIGVDAKKLKLDSYEIMLATQLISSDADDFGWDDIGGLDEITEGIKETLILPLSLRKQRASKLLCPPKGVLLFGPPGCGKTMLAKAVAKSAGARFINLQFSTLTDKWYGESQKYTNALFALAMKIQPVIIFIDEIDSFLRVRNSVDHECTAMMKAQFMSLWDGFTSDPNCQIIIMGATNRPMDVDPAILRRMPARFCVKKPDVEQRRQILDVILRRENVEDGIDLNEVAIATDGFSGSDLKEVCRFAAICRVKEVLRSPDQTIDDDERPLQLVDILQGVERVKETRILDQWASRNEGWVQ